MVFHEDQFFGDVEKTYKSKKVVDGVVDLTLIPSIVQTTGGKGVRDDPNNDEALGLQVKRVFSKGSSLLSQKPRSLRLGGILKSVNNEQSILHLIIFCLLMKGSKRATKKKRLMKIKING